MTRGARHLTLASAAALVLGCLSDPRSAAADPPHPVLYKGERLVPVEMPASGAAELSGWTRDGKGLVYSLHVREGQKLSVDFSSPSQFTYLVIFDVSKPDDEALYSSDEDGAVKTLAVTANSTWLIRPYYSRMAPRRGLGAPYRITVAAQ